MTKKKDIVDILNIVLGLLLICIIGGKVMLTNTNAYASGAWKGYAVYRDGVAVNLNDHAGIMGEDNINISLPIIQACGPGYLSAWVDFYPSGGNISFLDGHNYLGLYKPNSATMTSTVQNQFASKAQELLGISYTVFDQIDYNAGNNTWVYPQNITDLRCDGVIEYVYEWFGYRVGGADNVWDITRNSSSNLSEHQLTKITPRKQREYYLIFVTSSYPT